MNVNLILVLFTAAISLIAFNRPQLLHDSLFEPRRVWHNGEWWRMITSGFLHADIFHLLFNMIALFSFGEYVLYFFHQFDEKNGSLLYVIFYLMAIPASSVIDLLQHKDNPQYRALGASGAVSAVIFAAILFAPKIQVVLFFALPIPGYIFGPLYLLYCSYMAKRGQDNIGHMAHFMGSIYGFLVPVCLEPSLLQRFFQQII
jgi:membrane associated rhomboid family serine protease